MKKVLCFIISFILVISVFACFCQPAYAEQSQLDKIIEFAKNSIGSTKYVGLCQAFVYDCYKAGGIDNGSAGTALKAWEKWGVSTSKTDIPIGACVYFDERVGSEYGHVGLYIGNNKMIHSRQSVGQVVESSMTWYLNNCYLGWGWCGGVQPSSSTSTDPVSDIYLLTSPDGYQAMRTGASTSSEKITDIPAGNYVTVTKYASDGTYTWGYTTYDGQTGWICLYYVEKHETHSYGSWSTVKAATCTASGSQKRSCSCGAVETKTVAALGHNYSSSYTVDQAATCTESGSKSKHCSRCSARSEVTTIPATGHSYGAWVTESVVSCTEQGVQKRTCSTCQHVETETTAALGHDFAEEYTVDQAATCTASGSKSKHCSRCSAKSNVTTIPATGHSYSDWQILTEATLQKEGSRTKKCACGDSVTEAIPQLVGKVEQWNVALGDDLTVNFYLEVSDSIMSTAKVQLIQENSSQTAKISGLEKTADGLYKISVHMAATQMNDTITVMVKNGSDKAPSADYSIRQYCDTLLADESQTQYHTLIKEMLNYGAAAQAFFGYESDGAANEGITGAGQTAVPERAPEMSVSGKAGNVRFYGASLVYESKIAVRFYFSGDVSGCKFTIGEQTYTPVAKDGLYYIEVSDILPQNLDKSIAVTVASGQDTLTVSYSPLTYLVRMNAKGTETLQALMRALYNYHLAAKALNAE